MTGKNFITALPVADKKSVFSRWFNNPTFLALLGAMVVALVYGRVVALNILVGVVGGNSDGYENLWNDYWTRTALLNFKNPYFTDFIYYPIGVSLRYHTLHPLSGLLAIPLWPLVGPIVTTNLIFLLSLCLSVFCSYLLINDFVKSPLFAFAGATLFTYAYANHTQLPFLNGGQTEKLASMWLPLYLFYMFRLVCRPRWLPYAALSLFALLLLTFTDWQYTMYAVLITSLFAGFSLFTRRSWREKLNIWFKLGGVGLVWAGLIFFPLLLPMFNEAIKNTWMYVSDQSVYRSWDLLEYLLPGLTNPGYPAMLVAGLGLVISWRRKGTREGSIFWALCGGLAALFAMGPKLTIAENVTEIPLPYALLYKLPVLNAGRDPARFYTVAMLAFGVLFAFGLRYLWEKSFFLAVLKNLTSVRRLQVFSIFVVLLMSFTLFGYLVESGKAKADPLDVPDFYVELGKDPEQYAILEIPLFTEKGRKEAIYQAYQAYHHKIRFGGRYARDHKLSNPDNFSKRAFFVRDFYWLGRPQQNDLRNKNDIIPELDLSKVSVPLLNYWNVRYIVIWKEALTGEELAANRQLLLQGLGNTIVPVYEDSRMEAYQVPQAAALASKIVLDIGYGWYTSEVNAEGAYRWANLEDGSSAQIYLHNLSNKPVRMKISLNLLAFVSQTGQPPRTVKIDINGYPITSVTFPELPSGTTPDPAGTVLEKPVDFEVTIPPSKEAHAGFSILNFNTSEPPQSRVNRQQDSRVFTFGARFLRVEQL